MVTRNDVARLAGVSPAVVSYVINNSNYVSEEKRKAVLKAIHELGYHPNALARSLKSGRSDQLILMTDVIRSEMFSEITYYTEHKATEKGYNLTMLSYTQENALDALHSLPGGQYAGAFLFSALIPLSNEYVKKLNQYAENGLPIVLVLFAEPELRISPAISRIRPNIRESVCDAVDYLFTKGHRIIAYVGDGDPEATLEQGNGEGLRVNGYQDSLRKHNIEPDKRYIFFLDAFKYDYRKYLNVEGVIQAYEALTPEERPTAFYVNSDQMAAELIKSFQRRGVDVPRDIEIIGFGDTMSASIVTPELTTVALPIKEMGETAVSMLLDKIAGKQVGDMFFRLEMIKRASA